MSKGRTGSPGIQTYVLSRTLQPDSDKNVQIVAEDAATFVRHLKRLEGKDICLMGGGELAKSLFEADLVDEVGFNIHPVLLGSGILAFHRMSRQIDLEFMTSRAFTNGCVYW
jgi:dihydrofolate reductase